MYDSLNFATRDGKIVFAQGYSSGWTPTPNTGDISISSGIEVARVTPDNAAVLPLVSVEQRGNGLGGI
jgi:hypothetical protein